MGLVNLLPDRLENYKAKEITRTPPPKKKQAKTQQNKTKIEMEI